MAPIRNLGKRSFVLASAVMLAITVLLAAPTGASAAGGEQGELLIHGAGTVYAGPEAAPIVVTSPGGTGTFSFEVLNTGSSVAQFLLRLGLTYSSCDPSGCSRPAMAVTAGSQDVTSSITGANGYYTAPIAAGQTAVYTLKFTTPKSGVADNFYSAMIELLDTASNQLSNEEPIVAIADTTGSTDLDQFMNGTGQGAVRAPGTNFNSQIAVSSTTVGIGQTAKFSVKLQNDAAAASVIFYKLTEIFGCGAAWQVTAMQGLENVTSTVMLGTYHTPSLAHGKSTLLTISMKLLSSPRACLQGTSAEEWNSTTTDSGHNQATGTLVVNITAAS